MRNRNGVPRFVGIFGWMDGWIDLKCGVVVLVCKK